MTQRAQFANLLLNSLFGTCLLLAWGAGHLAFGFFSGSPITLYIDTQAYPVNLGELTLGNLFFSLGLMISLLFLELNGLRQTISFCLGSLGGLILIWIFLKILPSLPFLIDAPDIGALPQVILDLTHFHLLEIIQWVLAIIVVSVVCGVFKIWFKGEFYIIRYLLGHLIGLSLAGLIISWPLESYNSGIFLSKSLAFYIQTLSLFLIYYPLHYFIKWPLLLFVGSAQRDLLKDKYSVPEATVPESKPEPIRTDQFQNPFSKEESVSIKTPFAPKE
jgi:hypothetical protein